MASYLLTGNGSPNSCNDLHSVGDFGWRSQADTERLIRQEAVAVYSPPLKIPGSKDVAKFRLQLVIAADRVTCPAWVWVRPIDERLGQCLGLSIQRSKRAKVFKRKTYFFKPVWRLERRR